MRRALHCEVLSVQGTTVKVGSATSIGPDGAFLVAGDRIEPGTKLRFRFRLPLTPPATVDVGAVVVRATPDGVGVRFTEIASRDRSLLVQYAHHMTADESVKRIQRRLGDVAKGHLIPVALTDDARRALEAAARERTSVKAVLAARSFHVCDGALTPIEGERLTIETRADEPAAPFSAVYVAFQRREVQYVFESVVLEARGRRLTLQVPERIYSTERRARRRTPTEDATAEFLIPHAPGGILTAKVLDYDEGGFSVALPGGSLVLPGARLPGCRVTAGGKVVVEAEAIVRNVRALSTGEVRVGIEFARTEERATFEARETRDFKRPLGDRIRAVAAAAKSKLARLLGRAPERTLGLELVRFRTSDKEEVVGILDRTTGAGEGGAPVDVAVAISPALGKRKEAFALVARTIVENFEAIGKSAVVLRYDEVRSQGESWNDPECREEGRELNHYTLSQVGKDIDAAMKFLKRSFQPRKTALVTVSIGAIPARRFFATGRMAPVDSWISLFGCSDATDIAYQMSGGEDLFAQYKAGTRGKKVLCGIELTFERYVQDAIDLKGETLEDALVDMGAIKAPITWVVGTHDYWVRRERIRRLLDAPGGGVREIFEVPTGHLVKAGEEALETFKLVAESIAKHALGISIAARDPDLARFEAQTRREWGRVKKRTPGDAVAYWQEHLFGKEGEKGGYDIVRTSAMYARFVEDQIDALDLEAGRGARLVVADLGCGTGNISEALARRAVAAESPLALRCHDLVPEALPRTREKVEAALAPSGEAGRALVSIETGAIDLEVSRLKPVADFLSGASHGVEALAGAVEGLKDELPARLRAAYTPELHAILRGKKADAARVRALVPSLDEEDVDAVLDLSCAARFLEGRSLPDDLARTPAVTADDLRLRRLRFRGARRALRTALPEATFDRAVASLVVSYLFRPGETIAEVFRSLKPGGVFVVSSLKPNFDFSETHIEVVRRIQEMPVSSIPPGETRAGMLEALRGFSNYVGLLVELEEQGLFRFLDGAALRRMMEDAGFVDVRIVESLGDPGQAVVARGVRPQE